MLKTLPEPTKVRGSGSLRNQKDTHTYLKNDDHLTRWILEALCEITPEQMEEFLFQVSRQEFSQPESFDLDLIQQSTQQE